MQPLVAPTQTRTKSILLQRNTESSSQSNVMLTTFTPIFSYCYFVKSSYRMHLQFIRYSINALYWLDESLFRAQCQHLKWLFRLKLFESDKNSHTNRLFRLHYYFCSFIFVSLCPCLASCVVILSKLILRCAVQRKHEPNTSFDLGREHNTHTNSLYDKTEKQMDRTNRHRLRNTPINEFNGKETLQNPFNKANRKMKRNRIRL